MDSERELWSQPPEPPRRRRRAFYATAGFAGLLGVTLVGLVAVALLGSSFKLPDLPGGATATSTPAGSALGSAFPSASVSAGPSFVRPTPTPVPGFVSYVVKSGDSLTSIARAFRTTPRSIAFWNREAHPTLDPLSAKYNPNRLVVGWILRIRAGAVFDEDELPDASPPAPPSPSPSPLPTTAAVAPTSVTATVLAHGSRETKTVALTFDIGGRLDPAVDITSWLVSHRVPATIFPTGKTGTTTVLGRDVLTIVRDHSELFSLGNHSWDHPNFTTLDAGQIASQLHRTETALASLVGRSSKPFFRPPYGAWNGAVRAAVGTAGWRYLVTWNVDTLDWKPISDGGPSAQQIVARVRVSVRPGSIVLMHLGGYHTLEALPGILAVLADNGLQPVTLEELLGTRS